MCGGCSLALHLDGRFAIFVVCHPRPDHVAYHSHDSGMDESSGVLCRQMNNLVQKHAPARLER